MADTITLRWQETCDYQTTFTLAAETVEQTRSDGFDPVKARAVGDRDR